MQHTGITVFKGIHASESDMSVWPRMFIQRTQGDSQRDDTTYRGMSWWANIFWLLLFALWRYHKDIGN